MSYVITWITENLGVGRAPMSYEDFDAIRKQGINAIINLCHEYSDLHELEEQAGFEVYYLPINDECAPDMDEMEKGLEWLDEAIYLKKKVLVHCRFGQGRTGTITSAYLLRRGLGMKRTKRELKKTKAVPATYRQWKLLRKYSKKQGVLSLQLPKVAHDRPDDLSPFFKEYQNLAAAVDSKMTENGTKKICGNNDDHCCHTSFYIPLLEALYLNDSLNRLLTASARNSAIERALDCQMKLEAGLKCLAPRQPGGLPEINIRGSLLCPLSIDGSCILYDARPIRCRSNGNAGIEPLFLESVMAELNRLSNETFLVLAGQLPRGPGISASLIDTVSGKFIQTYFHLMAATKE
ncbi:MAG: dual specificity protein phosphatase family protein [Deltaproteobacteria bacterium]|nr:dual specificity protein phosphatase family protein [Deltaproteobacteria bacterium]